MNIQKGLVKDLGFPDTECQYVIAANGVQYYFVEGITLKEGNIVVTPNVREAVSHQEKVTLGVMNKDGVLIVPCINKRVELLVDRFILVEATNVVSPKIKEELDVKDDPIKSKIYNQNSIEIKQQMQEEMGSLGSFIFDDMFSEANILDMDGNRILGTEASGVSFIGKVDKDLYMHTIDPDDSIKVIKAPVELGPVIDSKQEIEEKEEQIPEIKEESIFPSIPNKQEFIDEEANLEEQPVKIDDTPNILETLKKDLGKKEPLNLSDFGIKDTKESEFRRISKEPTEHKKIYSFEENRKSEIYDKAVSTIKQLIEKINRINNENEDMSLKLRGLESSNKELSDKAIQNEKTINDLDEEVKKLLDSTKEQKEQIEEQNKIIDSQEALLKQHESGEKELEKLIEESSKTLSII